MNAGAFKKGQKGGPGRPKGLPNKSTQAAREAIAAFVDGNADRLQGWLDEIAAEKGPQAAFECFSTLLEYHVPKLARQEITGKDNGPVKVQIGWMVGKVKMKNWKASVRTWKTNNLKVTTNKPKLATL